MTVTILSPFVSEHIIATNSTVKLENNSRIVGTDIESLGERNIGLQEVANQFEAIFLEKLLQNARDSKLADGLFDSKSDKHFEQMFDQELAKNSSEMVDIGIAEAIVQQMSRNGI